MKPISLLFVMRDRVPPFRPDVRVLFGKYLHRLGVQSDLVGPAEKNVSGSPLWPAGKLQITGPATGMLAEALKPLRDVLAIARLGQTYDIVQVRDRTFSALVSWAYARLTGKRFVFWMSFPMVEGYEERAREVGHSKGLVVWAANHLRGWLARRVYYGFIARRADHLFVQSEAMLAWMAAKGIARARMTAVPMGVDTEALAAHTIAPSTAPQLQGRRVIVYLGALGLARQPVFMLDVVAVVRETYPDVLLVLAGDGEAEDEKQYLRRAIVERGLEQHVWLTGWLPQADALRLVRAAELGLSPVPRGPLFDVSSPTKALEYLALGVPCVGNDIPDQRYVLERSGAGVCVPMEVIAFAETVITLLSQPEHTRGMGARGPAFVEAERSYSVLAEVVLAQYKRLVSDAYREVGVNG